MAEAMEACEETVEEKGKAKGKCRHLISEALRQLYRTTIR
jgi:hypothetical protein